MELCKIATNVSCANNKVTEFWKGEGWQQTSKELPKTGPALASNVTSNHFTNICTLLQTVDSFTFLQLKHTLLHSSEANC